jgi:hypothetical protein
VYADDLLARDREQPERIVLAQVCLGEERDRGEVGELGDVAGVSDARLGEALRA